MEIKRITQALRARRAMTAAVLLAAVLAAVAVKVSSHSVPTGTATTQIMVDSPMSVLADLKQDPLPLISRAQVFAQLMTSGAVLDSIARQAAVNPRDVTAEGPYSGAGQQLDVPTPSEARSAQVVAKSALYHLTFVADANIPLVTASVEGPTPSSAARIAAAVLPGVQSWLRNLQGSVPASKRVIVRQLGNPQAGAVNTGSSTIVAAVAGFAVALFGLLLVAAAEGRSSRRAAAAGAIDPDLVVAGGLGPTVGPAPLHAPHEPASRATVSSGNP